VEEERLGWPFIRKKRDLRSRTCVLCEEASRDGFWIMHKTCWLEFWKVLRANECTETIAEYGVNGITDADIECSRFGGAVVDFPA
jgi:hypothetical protein